MLAVVVIHVAAVSWGSLDFGFNWQVLNIYDSITRWGVPIFVMISGAIFIPRVTDMKTLFGKNILRLVISFVVWSLFYALVFPVAILIFKKEPLNFNSIVEEFLSGAYHMWFIPMMIGLYLCLPLLKKICESEKTMKYYLIVSFFAAFVIPQFFQLMEDFTGGVVQKGFRTLATTVNNL